MRKADRISSALDDAKSALWGVRLRSHRLRGYPEGCWCLDLPKNDTNWFRADFNHDHRCTAARKTMNP